MKGIEKMDLNKPKQIVGEILSKNKEIINVAFVGCGASYSDLYPAKYFLEHNSQKIRVAHLTASEFNKDTPHWVNENTIVVSASLGGTTPETVEANAVAKSKNAHIISLTRAEGAPLTKDADYVIIHRFAENYGAKLEKTGYAMDLALEILQQIEGYEYYDQMVDGFTKIYDLAQKSAESIRLDAKKFGEKYKDDECIYVMSSGASLQVAYSTSICLLMEMQWINSGTFHSGEFFHGPFEIVDKDVPFILLMNDGPTRSIDSRALTFLDRFDAKTTVIDSLDFGLSSVIPKEVVNYFNPMLLVAVFRVYAEELSEARQHPLTKRRYMWKLTY